MNDPMILFICSGNVCRSPMAEYLLRARLRGPLARWRVGSAGVAAMDGWPASPEAVAALAERGIDLTPHRSRFLSPELVDDAAMIVVMTRGHDESVRQRFPEAAGRVFLLRGFDGGAREEDLADPIGLPLDGYRQARDQIEAALPDLMLFMHESGQSRSGKVKS